MPNKQPFLDGSGPIFFPDAGTLAFIQSIGGLLTLHSAGTNKHLDVYTTGTGVFRVNGVPLAASAYTDTTNASNITSGVLPVAQIPNAVKPPNSQSFPGRTSGTVYQNTTSKVVYVTISFTPGNNIPARVFCDASPSPSTQVALVIYPSGGGFIVTISFIVLPNYYYKILPDSSTIAIQVWTEWF